MPKALVDYFALAIPLSIPLALALVVKSTSPEVSFAKALGASIRVLLQGAFGMLFLWALASARHSGV